MRIYYRYTFYSFWFLAALLIILRMMFDAVAYVAGSTVAVRITPPGVYQYLLHLPPGYTDFGEPRPLIVFLHGAGETNKGLTNLSKCDLRYYVKGQIKDFPFIVVSPETPKHGWKPLFVKQLIEHIVQDDSVRYRIDPNRIYLTGYSMGGFGTFETASTYPEIFAAIVPVAGGGVPENALNLKNMPTWAFHGDADDVVPYECSEKMIDAIKDAGFDEARLTTLHGAGHGIGGDVYRNPELFRWMLSHRKEVIEQEK